jgi:mRNA-degrading endonuclease RelE of RelBE toxin-antitoxin system
MRARSSRLRSTNSRPSDDPYGTIEFRIADTFTDSLARLTGDEEKAVKTTAFDLQLNPANPGMSFHKLAKAKEKRFWSVRISTCERYRAPFGG